MGNEFCSANCSTGNSEPEEMKLPKSIIYTNHDSSPNNQNFPKINFETNKLKEYKEKIEDLSDDELDFNINNINNGTKKQNEINLKNSLQNYFNKDTINNKESQTNYDDNKKEELNRLSSNSQQNNNRENYAFSFKKNQNNLIDEENGNNREIDTNMPLNKKENFNGKITYKPIISKDNNYLDENKKNEINTYNNQNEKIFQKFDFPQKENESNYFQNNINNNINIKYDNSINSLNDSQGNDINKNNPTNSFNKLENQLINDDSKNNSITNSNTLLANPKKVTNSNHYNENKSRNPNQNKNNTKAYKNNQNNIYNKIQFPNINTNVIPENKNINNTTTLINSQNSNMNTNDSIIRNNSYIINNKNSKSNNNNNNSTQYNSNNNNSSQYNSNNKNLIYSNQNNNFIKNKKRIPQHINNNKIIQQVTSSPMDLTPEQIEYIFQEGNKKALLLKQNKSNENIYKNYTKYENVEPSNRIGIITDNILPSQNVAYEEKLQIGKTEISPKKVITKQNKTIKKTLVHKPIINTILSKKVIQKGPIIKYNFNNNYIFDNSYNNNPNKNINNYNNNYNIYPIQTNTNSNINTNTQNYQNHTPQKKNLTKTISNNYNIYPIKTNTNVNNATNNQIYQNLTPQKKVVFKNQYQPSKIIYKYKSPQNYNANINYFYSSPIKKTEANVTYTTPTKIIPSKNTLFSPVVKSPTIVNSPIPMTTKITPNNTYNQITYIPTNNTFSQVPYVTSTNYRALTPDIKTRTVNLVQSPIKHTTSTYNINNNLNNIPNANTKNNINYVNVPLYITGNNMGVISQNKVNDSIINQSYLRIIQNQNQNMNSLNNYNNYQIDSYKTASSIHSHKSFYSDSPKNRHYNRARKPVYYVSLNNTPDKRRKNRDYKGNYRQNRFMQGNYDLNSSIISNNLDISYTKSFSQDARLPLANNTLNEHYIRNVSPYESPIGTPKSNNKNTYLLNDLNDNINIKNNLNNVNNNIMNNLNNKNNLNNYNINNKNIYNLQYTSPNLKRFRPEIIAQNNKKIIDYYSNLNCKKTETFSPNAYLFFYPQNQNEFMIPQNEIFSQKEITYLINNNANSSEKYSGSVNLYNQRHGLGKLTSPTSQKIGTWRNGQFSGWGREILNNGEVFEGRFLNGNLNGKGIYKYMNILYIGDFINNTKHGNGEMITKEYVYIGEFKNNKINGYGKITFYNCKDGKSEYEGFFKDNIIEGKGVLKWINGNTYEGEVKNGKMNGYGIFTPNNGIPIKGYFKDGVREDIDKNHNNI